MNRSLRSLFSLVVLLVAGLYSKDVSATHVYGADFTYAFVSGTTYRVTLTVYGDCEYAFDPTRPFAALQGATPTVYVFNGGTLNNTLTLNQQGAAVEVTPVCPAQTSQTNCRTPGGIVPGVKRFIYSANVNLNTLSANWRFVFLGELGASQAGRSNNITNIAQGSIMKLEATLNNTLGPNSSPTYTTIPTPFFCVNQPASYNPGTVDPNGNTLSFSLVTGLDAGTPPGSGFFVNYLPGYSATAPLSTSLYSFTTSNGQLDFTPNSIQRSLVVSLVTEYNGATVVGTSMREMTFVVQNCNNNPPGGGVSSPSTGVTLVNSTTLTVCKDKGTVSFSINPTDADGNSIDVTSAGLPAGATFTVTNNNTPSPTGAFSWNIAAVTPGTYTFFVTYTDDGCPLASKQTIAYTITVLPNPTLTYTLVSPATCTKKAVFTLTPGGANSPYTINFGSITRSGVTGTITDSLAPGTYTFTVTALNGCDYNTGIVIAQPPLTQVTATVKRNTCNGTSNGQVTINAVSGTPPYTYAVGAGAYLPGNTFGSLASGTYIFHVKDVQGCIKDTSIVIGDSLTVYGTIAVTNVLCNGDNTGALTVVGNGGINPYVYALGTGPFGGSGVFGSLVAGTYVVRIKDNLGCFKDTNAVITQPTKLAVTAVVTNVTCNGLSDGRVVLSGSGGTPAYTYALGTGAYGASGTFNGLIAGTYTFHVKDNNNCIKDTIINVTQPLPLAFTTTITNVLCFGGSTGTVTVNATGGTTPYTYAANTNPFTPSNVLTGLNAATHSIHLKDANGCTKDTTVAISEPTALGIAYTATNPTCFGGTNGTITITGTGGTVAYTYALDANPFVASGLMTGLAAGTYAVHIKDANGCTKDTTATLGQPTAIAVTAQIHRPRCTPLVNGFVILSASGGTPGYTYARGTGPYQPSSTFTGLGSGTYIFHVRDANNCIKDTTIAVTDSIFVRATTLITNVKCFGGSDGSIEITGPSGGDAPYVYALNTNPYAATNPIINLTAATYTLHVKDANGCILDTLQTVTQPTIVVPNVTVNDPTCYLDSNGTLVMNTTGGTPGYTYALGTGTYGPTPTFTNLRAGTYTVHVRDANNCQRDTTVVMGQPTKLVYNFISMTHLICNGDSSGTVTIRAGGATPPYSYSADIRPYQTSNILTGLSAGVHAIRLQDANGCKNDTSVRLWEPTKVHVLIDTIITPTCEAYKDGSVRISATGGNPGYTYSPNNANFDTTRNYRQLQEGTYSFYTKDVRGCLADTTIALVGYPHIVVNAPIVIDASCNGYADGRFQMNVTGGNAPLTYYMKSPADTNATGLFDSLKMGIYAIHIVDSTGCFKDTSIKVNHPDTLIASTLITPNDCVGYDEGGAVEVQARGGTQPYNYLWSTTPRQTSDRITGLANGKYAVIVTDGHNCADTTIAIVPYDNCCKPFIANAFTPNGDGKNDKFHVMFKGDIKLENFSIFNRYGQRIFYTTSSDVGWDGTWNDRNQDAGTYFYYIKLICGNKGDNVQEYKGDLTLIR